MNGPVRISRLGVSISGFVRELRIAAYPAIAVAVPSARTELPRRQFLTASTPLVRSMRAHRHSFSPSNDTKLDDRGALAKAVELLDEVHRSLHRATDDVSKRNQ